MDEEELDPKLTEPDSSDDPLTPHLLANFGIDERASAAIFSGLRREPSFPVAAKSVYLDLNHWIALAKPGSTD
jgi:hypothetical protein